MIHYRDPDRTRDSAELNAMARESFVESFGGLYRPKDLALFLNQAYGPTGLAADIVDPAFDWRIALDDDKIIGFVKIGRLGVPANDPLPGAIELRQLYVLKPWQGAGVAARLMEWAIDRAKEREAPELYLSVFDHNHRAKAFYKRYGFDDVGHCEFRVGEQIDRDRMWRRTL